MKDLVDRQSVMAVIMDHSGGYEYVETPTQGLLDDIKKLPSKTPEKREGRDIRGALIIDGWHLEVTFAEIKLIDGWPHLESVDIEGMNYRGGFFRQTMREGRNDDDK